MERSGERGAASGRGRPWAPLSVGSFAFLILGAWGTGDARANPLLLSEMASDTVRLSAPRLFERRVFFSPEYLKAILAAARRGMGPASSAGVSATERRELVAGYSLRYRISPELALTIVETALAEGIDPELGFRLIRVESVFDPNARGPGGSLGLTQLMPTTARAVDRTLRTDAAILEPTTNLRVGFRYLRRMIERYGDVRLGLLAYNRGEGTVDRALRAGRDPENGYSAKVLGRGGSRYRGSGVLTPD